MKKWWNDIRRFERYLFGRLNTAEQEELAQQLNRNPALREELGHQRTTYEAIRWYGRRKVRREIKNTHRRLITEQPDSSLSRRIRRLFSKGDNQ